MKYILFITVFCLLVVTPVFAAPCPPNEICNPLDPTSDFAQLAEKIGEWLLNVGMAVAALMVVVGGLQIMTAGGEPERFQKGKKTITWALIGLVILLLAQGLVSLIKDILGVTP